MSSSSHASKPNHRQIRALCRRRLAALGAPLALLDQVTQVVQRNCANGRFERYERAQRDHRAAPLAAYVDSVIFHTSREQARVQRLEDGDAVEWNRLRDLLARCAFGMVRALRADAEVSAEALEFAQQACCVIFREPYPFDVAFEAWATTILKRLVLTRYCRSPDALNQPRSSSAGRSSWQLLTDGQSPAPFERVENQMLLLQAIDQLRSRAQRQVIIAAFLEEQEYAQIARQLGKSKQAIYNLRQRALAQLRVILAETKVKEKRTKKHQCK